MKLRLLIGAAALSLLTIAGCNSSSIEDALDLVDEPDRKTVDTAGLGINAFANDSRFGSISAQLSEVKNTLKLNHIRILMNWSDSVQSSPSGAYNFSFYDDLVARIPSGVDALVILNGVPSWMNDASNWEGGNPRLTFVNHWVKEATKRYGGHSRIIGFQIWNEPNNDLADNILLGLRDSAPNYVELLAAAENYVRENAPGKLLLNAATTAINQNYPETLDYNRAMRDAGALNLVDVWALHFYGSQYENVVRNGGVEDFADGLGKRIWVTESGAQGVNKQLEYAERTFAFLREKLDTLERIYIYQFTEATPSDVSYGLRTLDSAFPVSDLYIELKNR
jgi:hypothetical protein